LRRFEVISGERRRREWTVAQKLAIVAESFASVTSISDVARRYQLNRNQLFHWRAQFRRGELGGADGGSFVPVTVGDWEGATDIPASISATVPNAVIEVVIGAATVRVPPAADDMTLRRVLAAVHGLR
jgi:transposase